MVLSDQTEVSASCIDFKTATDLEVLRRSHAFLIKMMAAMSIASIVGLVSVVYFMQQGHMKAIASIVNAMARMPKWHAKETISCTLRRDSRQSKTATNVFVDGTFTGGNDPNAE